MRPDVNLDIYHDKVGEKLSRQKFPKTGGQALRVKYVITLDLDETNSSPQKTVATMRSIDRALKSFISKCLGRSKPIKIIDTEFTLVDSDEA